LLQYGYCQEFFLFFIVTEKMYNRKLGGEAFRPLLWDLQGRFGLLEVLEGTKEGFCLRNDLAREVLCGILKEPI